MMKKIIHTWKNQPASDMHFVIGKTLHGLAFPVINAIIRVLLQVTRQGAAWANMPV